MGELKLLETGPEGCRARFQAVPAGRSGLFGAVDSAIDAWCASDSDFAGAPVSLTTDFAASPTGQVDLEVSVRKRKATGSMIFVEGEGISGEATLVSFTAIIKRERSGK